MLQQIFYISEKSSLDFHRIVKVTSTPVEKPQI